MKHEGTRGKFRPYHPPTAQPQIKIVAPPGPVTQYCPRPESDGVGIAGRFFFPEKGTVTNFRIIIDSLKAEEKAIIQIRPVDGVAGAADQIEVAAGLNKIKGEFDVDDGERLVLDVISPQVTGVWVSFLYKNG